MGTQVVDFVDVEARTESLGCSMLTGVSVLPLNFEHADSKGDLCYDSIHLDLRRRLRDSGIPGTSLEGSEDQAVLVLLRESAAPEWIAPTIFVAAQAVLQDPALGAVLLGVVSNFLYDQLPRVFRREPSASDEVEFSFVKYSAHDRIYKKATFKGSWKDGQLRGFKEFRDIVCTM